MAKNRILSLRAAMISGQILNNMALVTEEPWFRGVGGVQC